MKLTWLAGLAAMALPTMALPAVANAGHIRFGFGFGVAAPYCAPAYSYCPPPGTYYAPPPVVYSDPAPVCAPPPVVYQPAPTYYAPPAYYSAPTVVVTPGPYYVGGYYGRYHHHYGYRR